VNRLEAHGALVAPRPRFPRAVSRTLIDRRVRLLAGLSDDVCDLSQPAARSAVLAAARSGRAGRRYATVLSVGELVRFPDLVLALTGVSLLLDDTGELVLVEPVHHTGARATLLASLWVFHPALSGAHVERDVGAAVRAVGLTFGDLERFSVPTAVWPLRLWMQARVRRITTEAVA
jgi:hypothetical protein